MGKKEEAVALWEEIGNETQIGMNSATRLRTAALRILEALDEVSAQSDDTKADKDSFETFTCGRFIVKTDNTGNEIEIFNRDDEKIMFRVRNGQVFSYGRTNVAHGAFNAYTNNGEIRYEINSLNGNIYLKLHNDLNENTILIDSNGISKLLGLDVQHERIRNVGQATADYDAVNLYQLLQSTSIVDNGTKNLQGKGVTSIQLLYGAVDQLVAGSNGIPNRVVYTRAGDNKIVTRIEYIQGGTIETRNKWHSGGTLQDGKLDFAEFKNSVTGDWVRYSNIFVNGYLMESTVTIITAWTI